jgi:hypothetical protein
MIGRVRPLLDLAHPQVSSIAPAELLAALRLWAESQFRTTVRVLLEAGDTGALNGVARELLELGTPEEQTAGRTIVEIASRPSGELMAIAAYALRAL